MRVDGALRKAGALVLLGDEGPLFYVDASARSLLAWGEPNPDDLGALRELLSQRRERVLIKRVNGDDIFASEWREHLVGAGFRLTPSGLR